MSVRFNDEHRRPKASRIGAHRSHLLEKIARFRETVMGKTGLTSERAVLIGDIPGHDIEHRVVVARMRRFVELTLFAQSLNSARFRLKNRTPVGGGPEPNSRSPVASAPKPSGRLRALGAPASVGHVLQT